ncbi:MAG: hypothetical protein WCY18_00930 [Methanofastidiosum sp.]|jgi:hypothetical protein
MSLKNNKYLGLSGIGFIPRRLIENGVCEYPTCSIWDKGYMFQIKYVLSLVNIGLIFAVFVLYANIYRKTNHHFH